MEGARHRRQGKESEVVSSTTKKAPEEASKPPNNTTVKATTKEGIRDEVLKPSELTAETFKRKGLKPPESTATAVVPTKATQGPSSTTRESPPTSWDATGPGSSVDAKQPPMLARQPSKKDSRKPRVQDTHREGGGGVPTHDVRTPLPLPPVPPPTIEGDEHPSHKVKRAVGSGTTGGSSSRPPPGADRTYLIFLLC